MYDSEDYHTGRAAAYYTVVGLLRTGRPVTELLIEVERLQLAAEVTACERAAEPMTGTRIALPSTRSLG